MEPAGQRRTVRTGMTIIHPCSRAPCTHSQVHHLCGGKLSSCERMETGLSSDGPAASFHIHHSQGPPKNHQLALRPPWETLTPTGQELSWRALENSSSGPGNHKSVLHKEEMPTWGRKTGSRHSKFRASRSEPHSSANCLESASVRTVNSNLSPAPTDDRVTCPFLLL